MYEFSDRLRQRISAGMGAHRPRADRRSELRRAAVAIALVAGEDGEAAFLLTGRAAGLRAHARQWALPGGRAEEGEEAADTALRELDEELGLRRDGADVLGRLDDYPTRSGYVITPVVVWCEGELALAPDPLEVASVHTIALAELDHPGSPRFLPVPESREPLIQLHLMSSWIHAPTAAILYQFREVALRGRHVAVSHYEQPVWAWR